MRVRVGNDLLHWVRFFLNGVLETATKGRQVFQGILALRHDVDERLATLGKRVPNARDALAVLYRRPVITAGDLQAELKVSAPTAQSLVRDLRAKGIVSEATGQMRDRVYVFHHYLKLFTD